MWIHGDLCEGNGLDGTQEAFGQGHFPPNHARKPFCRVFPISRKILGPPWAPGGFPIGPLKELLPILPPAALFQFTGCAAVHEAKSNRTQPNATNPIQTKPANLMKNAVSL